MVNSTPPTVGLDPFPHARECTCGHCASKHVVMSDIDLVTRLHNIAPPGLSAAHVNDIQAIRDAIAEIQRLRNCVFGADKIRRERDDLRDIIAGIGRTATEVAKSYKG